jgi:hypothetical protein
MIGLYDMGSDKRADRLDGLLPNLNDRLGGLLLTCLRVTGGCAASKFLTSNGYRRMASALSAQNEPDPGAKLEFGRPEE